MILHLWIAWKKWFSNSTLHQDGHSTPVLYCGCLGSIPHLKVWKAYVYCLSKSLKCELCCPIYPTESKLILSLLCNFKTYLPSTLDLPFSLPLSQSTLPPRKLLLQPVLHPALPTRLTYQDRAGLANTVLLLSTLPTRLGIFYELTHC